jgi:sugar/nucleoside kinase (ribokinase family)
VCLGEALVDVICERPVDDLAQADAFVPHFGGAGANVAVTAARHGAHVALGSGAGDDAWGRWIRARLAHEHIELSLFELVAGSPTPLAIVAVNAAGEPTYQIYGETIASAVRAPRQPARVRGPARRRRLFQLEHPGRLPRARDDDAFA